MHRQTVLKLRKLVVVKPVELSTEPRVNTEAIVKPALIDECSQPDYAHLDIFHRAVSPIMMLGQWFAIMPLTGVHKNNPRRIRFQFKSFQMFNTLLFLCSSSILMLSMLRHLIRIGVTAKNFVGLVFFLCVQSACLLFIILAYRWPSLIRYWTRIELIFTRPPYETPKSKLSRRVRLAAFVIIGLSLLEHALYLASAVITYKRRVEICASERQTALALSLDDYVQTNYDYVFEILPYNHFVAIFIMVGNLACTFIWNYMDLFIAVISTGIAYRFEQITKRILKLEGQEVPESTFIEIREHFVKMCELLERVDESMSGIILLSSMNNLYFICYQLLNIFNKLRWPINYVYFWYSLIYLIGRTAFVLLRAAAINDQSRGAVGVLRRVSGQTWCIEIERLIFQMSTQTVALTGKKFYFLTRTLLFGMAGTIVTYELVLLQFDEDNRAKGLPPLCG